MTSGWEGSRMDDRHDWKRPGTRTTRDILDMIDADILRAAQVEGGASPRIKANRDRIAASLGLY